MTTSHFRPLGHVQLQRTVLQVILRVNLIELPLIAYGFTSSVLEVLEQVDYDNETLAVGSFNVHLVWVARESGRSARDGVFRVARVGVAERGEVHIDSMALDHLEDGVVLYVLMFCCISVYEGGSEIRSVAAR